MCIYTYKTHLLYPLIDRSIPTDSFPPLLHQLLGDVTKPSDFTMGELPMDRVEWTGNLMKNHPLCDMPADFVNTTLTMHHKESHKMFISFDGRGDVTALRNMGAVFSTVLDDASDSGRLMPYYYCCCCCY